MTDTYTITVAIATQIAQDSVTAGEFYHFAAGSLTFAVLLLVVAVAFLLASLVKVK